MNSHTHPWESSKDMLCKTPSIGSVMARACEVFLLPRRYAIKSVQVLAKSARVIVRDCMEAEDNVDARDKFFM